MPASTANPAETDFEVRTSVDTVVVLFRPTVSYYTFNRFTNSRDIAEFGPLSPHPRVRHVRYTGRGGGTGRYSAPEVQAMAFNLALQTVRQAPDGAPS
jgi:hypothetical protein